MTIEDQSRCEIRPFPRVRQLQVDGGRLAADSHAIHALLEVDVTEPRRLVREHKARSGESLSFTAFLVACLGKAVDADKRVHACRSWRNRLFIFDEVNANTAFAAGGGRQAHHSHILRGVNRRSVREIHDEIRSFQRDGATGIESRSIARLAALPWPARRLVYWSVLNNPRLQHKFFGTVMVTSVGMFGDGGGWGIPFAFTALSMAVGGIAWKPWVVQDPDVAEVTQSRRIEPREIMNLTLTFNHDIVDGAPAARFADQLRKLIERGDGLAESISEGAA